MTDKELFPDADLHRALTVAYRQLASAAPSESSLTMPHPHRAGRGRLALVVAAAVAVIAIPTVAIARTQHYGGSSRTPAAPPSATASPSPSGPSSPSSSAPPILSSAVPMPSSAVPTARALPPSAYSFSPTTAAHGPSSAAAAPSEPTGAGSVSPPPTVGQPRTVYPTPEPSNPGLPVNAPITGPDAVKDVPRTPFSIGYLPAGYAFDSAQTSRSGNRAPGVTVDFGFVKADTWTIFISSAPFDNSVWSQDGQMGSTTVNGRPAMAMDGLVAVKVGSYLVLVQSKTPAPTAELRRIAEGLTFASDPDNMSSWFRSATAIPGAADAASPGVTTSAPPRPSESPTASATHTSVVPSATPIAPQSAPSAKPATTEPPTNALLTQKRGAATATPAPQTAG